MAFPEILTIRATIPHLKLTLSSVPVDFAPLKILASPAAVPVHFQKIPTLDFLNDQGHRNQALLYIRARKKNLKLGNLLIATINIHDENFFSKNRQILAHAYLAD
ncbi:hypothetical protein AUK22_01990 [bacterium CG2_30_54_10]|nr:MAG: hypothetical protein AUK22_01990 [bacterium CG2_30_54_10]